jgi:nucleotide-binding universal stress UspA family protein
VADTAVVVVGVDGAHDGVRAALWAAHAAVRLSLPATVVHVREYRALLLPRDERAVLDAEAEKVVAEAVAAMRTTAPDLDVRSRALDGSAIERLEELSGGASVLVVGCRGRGGFVRLTLGWVAEQVVQRSRAPAVVVHEGGEQSGPVTVGVDAHRDAAAALDFAFAQAMAGSRTLTAHHSIAVPPGVLPPFEPPGDGPRVPPEEMVAAALAPWRQRYPEVAVTVSVRVGSPAAHLVEASARSSLVVLGRHLGAVTAQVTRHASGPVAVV